MRVVRVMILVLMCRTHVSRNVVFGVPKAADQELFHLVHRHEVDDGVEAGVERHTVHLLEVTEEIKPVPVHELLVHQHGNGSQAGRQVEHHVYHRDGYDGDCSFSLVLPPDCGVARRDAHRRGGPHRHEEDPGGDDAGEGDWDDGDQDGNDNQHHV